MSIWVAGDEMFMRICIIISHNNSKTRNCQHVLSNYGIMVTRIWPFNSQLAWFCITIKIVKKTVSMLCKKAEIFCVKLPDDSTRLANKNIGRYPTN